MEMAQIVLSALDERGDRRKLRLHCVGHSMGAMAETGHRCWGRSGWEDRCRCRVEWSGNVGVWMKGGMEVLGLKHWELEHTYIFTHLQIEYLKDFECALLESFPCSFAPRRHYHSQLG